MYRLLVAIVLVSASTSASGPKDSSHDDYFPLAKGNTWEITRYAAQARDKWILSVVEVKQEGGKSIAVLKCQQHNGAFDTRLESDRSGVYRQSDVKGGSEPPLKVLPYPLKAGAIWDSYPPLPGAGGAFGKGKAEAKGLVEVEVPAGKFTAMEVVYTCKSDFAPGVQTFTSWYAPRIGLVKQVHDYGYGSMTFQLTKFNSGN